MGSLKNGLDRALDGAMVLLLVGIIVLVLLQVFQRYFTLFPVPWTEEMSRYLFVYLIFFGSALLIKEKGHITVDVVIERLPQRLQLLIFVLIYALILVLLYFFVRGMLDLTLGSTEVSGTSMSWFRMSYLYGGVLLGGALMIV